MDGKIAWRQAGAKKGERGVKRWEDVTMDGYEREMSEEVRNGERRELWERQRGREEEREQRDRQDELQT